MKAYINARLKGKKELVTLLIDNGKFVDIGSNIEIPNNAERIDLKGYLTIPPYVDPHLHLDYVFTANVGPKNESGTLFEGIQRWSEFKNSLRAEEIKARAFEGIKKEISHGVQFIRTHVDVTDPSLTGLKAILEVKQEVKDYCTIQIIAFPQEGMYSYKRGAELVEEALKMGCDVVGGIPHYEFTPELGEKSVKKVVELAIKYNKLIDIHCDETDDVNSRFVQQLAALAYFEGIGEQTTASHTCSLGSVDNSYFFKLLKILTMSKINFISCSTENIYLQGRQDTYPKRRGLTRVKELNDNGINVCFAQDSMSDPWYPLGNGNMMMILDHGLHICQMMTPYEIENALDLVTINGAKTMCLAQEHYGIQIGRDANFIVLNAKSEFEAVCERADIWLSIREGNKLFERTITESSLEFIS